MISPLSGLRTSASGSIPMLKRWSSDDNRDRWSSSLKVRTFQASTRRDRLRLTQGDSTPGETANAYLRRWLSLHSQESFIFFPYWSHHMSLHHSKDWYFCQWGDESYILVNGESTILGFTSWLAVIERVTQNSRVKFTRWLCCLKDFHFGWVYYIVSF